MVAVIPPIMTVGVWVTSKPVTKSARNVGAPLVVGLNATVPEVMALTMAPLWVPVASREKMARLLAWSTVTAVVKVPLGGVGTALPGPSGALCATAGLT